MVKTKILQTTQREFEGKFRTCISMQLGQGTGCIHVHAFHSTIILLTDLSYWTLCQHLDTKSQFSRILQKERRPHHLFIYMLLFNSTFDPEFY